MLVLTLLYYYYYLVVVVRTPRVSKETSNPPVPNDQHLHWRTFTIARNELVPNELFLVLCLNDQNTNIKGI